jgi:hypothetical protein
MNARSNHSVGKATATQVVTEETQSVTRGRIHGQSQLRHSQTTIIIWHLAPYSTQHKLRIVDLVITL